VTEKKDIVDELYQSGLKNHKVQTKEEEWKAVKRSVAYSLFLKSGFQHFNFVYVLLGILAIVSVSVLAWPENNSARTIDVEAESPGSVSSQKEPEEITEEKVGSIIQEEKQEKEPKNHVEEKESEDENAFVKTTEAEVETEVEQEPVEKNTKSTFDTIKAVEDQNQEIHKKEKVIIVKQDTVYEFDTVDKPKWWKRK